MGSCKYTLEVRAEVASCERTGSLSKEWWLLSFLSAGLLLGTVLGALQRLTQSGLGATLEVSTNIIPSLWVRKLCHREVEQLAEGHTARKWESQDCAQADQPLLITLLWKLGQELTGRCGEREKKGPRTDPRAPATNKEPPEEKGAGGDQEAAWHSQSSACA